MSNLLPLRITLLSIGLLLTITGYWSACNNPEKTPAKEEREQKGKKEKPGTAPADNSGNADNTGNSDPSGSNDPSQDPSQTRERTKREQLPPSDNPNREEGFDRHPDRLILTKHARCRMNCRHIDESEIREILAKGKVNYRKSEPAGRPDPKYALEGTTRDGQDVRIIIADSPRGTVVVTVIDLENEWKCDCR